MSLNDSLKINESLLMNGELLEIHNHISGKFIGEVTVEEIDKFGNTIFSETSRNDITLPGSIYVLEQMFKKCAKNISRFNHPINNLPIGSYSPNTINNSGDLGSSTIDSEKLTEDYISSERIFGFMVGRGGETAGSLLSPRYESTNLEDHTNTPSFLPIRKVNKSDADPLDGNTKYYLKYENSDNKYFYAKGFETEPTINVKYGDGSGDVTNSNIDYDVPILTYAEVVLNISEQDIREYFNAVDSSECYINQLGLVAGKPTDDGDYEDIKLVTYLNFKTKDLSNDENKIRFTYKVYCL